MSLFEATYRRIAKVDLKIPSHVSLDAKDLITKVSYCLSNTTLMY